MASDAADDKAPLVDSEDVQSVTRLLEILGGRWTLCILGVLSEHDRLRFTELRSLLPEVAPKVLTERLRQLDRHGLVDRRSYAEAPPRVEYQLTELAYALQPVFADMLAGCHQHLVDVERAADSSAAGQPARRCREE